jgi:hypothetical protein
MDRLVIEHAPIERLILFPREDDPAQVDCPEPFYRQIVGIDNFHTIDPFSEALFKSKIGTFHEIRNFASLKIDNVKKK